MKVKNIADLERIAAVDQEVWNTLSDTSYGRSRTVDALMLRHDLEVSEKLVRTWRQKYINENPPMISTMPMINEFGENTNSYSFNFSTANTDTVITSINPDPFKLTGVFPAIKQGKAIKSKTIVVMPDVQAPLHDVALVEKFTDFLGDFRPTELAQTGDFTDSTEISRWVRGRKEEYAGDLQAGFDASIEILEGIRDVFDGRFRIVRSNHDDRLENYLYGCAPGLQLRDLTFEKQLHLDEFDVEFIRDAMVELFDDWIMGHGDEGSMSPQAGKTAFGLAKNKFGVNVVCGHTHRAGITSESYGYNGKITRHLMGLEVGHFMDMRQAHYLAKKGGSANWQQAFGILEQVNGKVFPHLIPVIDGYFSVDGVSY